MPLWKIAWRSIQRRWLASMLTALSMALGVMLVVGVLLIHGIVADSFRSNSSLGYNMIVGAKGGRLQLVLNTVFHLSQPVENIPFSFYQEFLSAAERGDDRDGEFKMFTDKVIPVCLGDYYKNYRVVGTTPLMFDNFEYDTERKRKYEFADGRNFKEFTDENGYFEAVVGARVARELEISVGDGIAPTHGSPDGDEHDKFRVVGILKTSGTPSDRAVFVNMEGFFLLEGHAKPVKAEDGDSAAEKVSDDVGASDNVPAQYETALVAMQSDGPTKKWPDPLPMEQREVTALLLRTVSPLVTPGIRNRINEGSVAQAVLPIMEIYSLFELIVKPIQQLLLIITMMICIVSGVSILVSIYNSMTDRKREIAVMRALGASRNVVMSVVLLESIFLSLCGGLLGWLGGHALIGLASSRIEDRTGVQIGAFDMTPPVEMIRKSPIVTKLASMTGDVGSRVLDVLTSQEVMLIPTLIVLAVIVGFLPALSAYRTDVSKSLTANP